VKEFHWATTLYELQWDRHSRERESKKKKRQGEKKRKENEQSTITHSVEKRERKR